MARHRPNENKMSDGGGGARCSQLECGKSSQNMDAKRSAVRSIGWLDVFVSLVSDPTFCDLVIANCVRLLWSTIFCVDDSKLRFHLPRHTSSAARNSDDFAATML